MGLPNDEFVVSSPLSCERGLFANREALYAKIVERSLNQGQPLNREFAVNAILDAFRASLISGRAERRRFDKARSRIVREIYARIELAAKAHISPRELADGKP